MFINPRNEPSELVMYRILNSRMELSNEEKNYYEILEKGFEGEQKFDFSLKGNLKKECKILRNLLFKIGGNFFQIDSLIISGDTIYLCDVKNFEGDFYIEGDRWYSLSQSEIKNPLHQLKRCESLLRRLLQELGFNISIEAYLVFINPEFHLYQAPMNLPIIYPTQLNRFINKLNMKTSTLNIRHTKLTEKLLSLNVEESPFSRVPTYTYDQFKKGMTCMLCHSFINEYSEYRQNKLVCSNCGCGEDIDSAVLRNVREFALLFPERKITTQAIQEWCKIIKSKKVIRRILMKNLTLKSSKKYSYYEIP